MLTYDQDLLTELSYYERVLYDHDGHPNLVTRADVAKAREAFLDFVVKKETGEMEELRRRLSDETQRTKEMEARKDGAYEERNQVVAALAHLAVHMGWKAGIARTAIEGWSDDWHGCVYINLPSGQVSWHFHDSHAHLFRGLPPYTDAWDGHDTPEKYRRVANAPDFFSNMDVIVPIEKFDAMENSVHYAEQSRARAATMDARAKLLSGVLNLCRAYIPDNGSEADVAFAAKVDAALTYQGAPSAHPEAHCHECGGPNFVWFAPNPIWNAVVNERTDIICPQCFVAAARERGFDKDAWRLVPEFYEEPSTALSKNSNPSDPREAAPEKDAVTDGESGSEGAECGWCKGTGWRSAIGEYCEPCCGTGKGPTRQPPAVLGVFTQVPGAWVRFLDDEVGEGFFIGAERAKAFHTEPGFHLHALLPVYVGNDPKAVHSQGSAR